MSQSARAQVTVAILAGGQGVRVDGQDKGLMLLGSEPLVARVCERMRDQCAALLICANRNAKEYARYATVIGDADPGSEPSFRGPLAGIATALAICKTPWLLSVPVDSPCPPDNLAERLLAVAASSGSNGAVARCGTQREPTFALYRDVLAASAAEAVARNSSVRGWQDECGVVEVDWPESSATNFANLNTIADFQRWEADRRG